MDGWLRVGGERKWRVMMIEKHEAMSEFVAGK